MGGRLGHQGDSLARHSDELLARVLAALFAAGAVLGLVSLLLPHPSRSETGLIVVDAIAFAAVPVYALAARHIPRWLIHGTIAWSSPLICFGIYFTGVASGMYSTMFVWIALFAGFFFPARAAFLHLAWVVGCYAVVLGHVQDTAGYAPLTRWLLTGIALSAATGLTSWLVARARAAEERAQHFFELSHDMLCTARPDGHFGEINGAWSQHLGYSRRELLATPFMDLVHPDDRECTEAEVAEAFENNATAHFENRYRAKDGSWRWLSWTSAMSAESGVVYARATDVTEQKRADEERTQLLERLDSLARTDSLTGAPNRRWLGEELQRELARASRQGFDLCLAVIDLDHFKAFNDHHGHPEGDRFLADAVSAWREALRATDFLARYGGEEFVVLLPDCPLGDAREVVARLRAATPQGQTCSAGVARWDRHESAEGLISRADAALYTAKRAGRDRAVIAELAPSESPAT